MKNLRAVLLMEANSAVRVRQLANVAGIELSAEVVSSQAALARAFENPPNLLLSFGTTIIVPKQILGLPGLLALNVHAASPDYPGRDPHHFAIYDGAIRYGATMHFMTPLVDAGQIVDVTLFVVPADVTPLSLLELANEVAWKLINRLFKKLALSDAFFPIEGVCWGKQKTTRKMFFELCRVDGVMSEKEFNRRLRATSMPGYNNLYLEMYGHRFRLTRKP